MLAGTLPILATIGVLWVGHRLPGRPPGQAGQLTVAQVAHVMSRALRLIWSR
jgi:hypothetical protein